jgi:3-phosphoglycerate kinase
MQKKTVKDIEIKGKRVLMRVDFNVPMKEGVIQDDTRIRAALPTIQYVLQQGVQSLVLMSHLGDPKKDGQKAREKAEKAGKTFDEQKYLDGKHRLAPIAAHLAKLLGKEVKMAPACMGGEVEAAVKSLPTGGILMLENTRFHKEETSKDAAEREKMAKILAQYGDVYVNDAFGTAHRAHASTETVAHFLPAVSGFLMERELNYLVDGIVTNPARPFVAIIGGAKISSKLAVLESLLKKVDRLIIGGGMAYTFLKAKGLPIGTSLIEEDMIPMAREILRKAYDSHVNIYLPIDNMVTKDFSPTAEFRCAGRGTIQADEMGMDIGPTTINMFKSVLDGARTVFWNGPLGVFEFPNFANGTVSIAKAIAELKDCVSVIGGGDSVSAVNQAGVADKMSHISTGGGASLELVEGKTLPGVAALLDKTSEVSTQPATAKR